MDASTAKDAASSPLPVANSPNENAMPTTDAAMKRPQLLPAFEPFSSSPPALPSKKRQYPHDSHGFQQHYPTPVPTSSTGILPSSPRQPRPGLQRTASTMSERAPLCDVPTVTIPEDGRQLLLGRSSSSCHFQLQYNRLVSRVHVGVTYVPPSTKYACGRVMIECLGWNGCKVLCQGRVEELAKDNVLWLSNPGAEIILDVLDTRVILSWPQVDSLEAFGLSANSWFNMSPSRRSGRSNDRFASSPPAVHSRSPPVSPSPARHARKSLISPPSEGQLKETVKVYEDPASDDAKASPSAQLRREDPQLESLSHQPEYSDNENEENEPVVHTFGPFGSNLLSRFNSVSASSPKDTHPSKRRKVLNESSQSSPLSSPHRQLSESPCKFVPLHPPIMKKHANDSPIKNHVINQLAFSRVHSTPVSSIFKALPANLKVTEIPADAPENVTGELTPDLLRSMLDAIPCVGEIAREGKDAAGKPLENEFYYMPERDENVMRRETVVNGMGSTGLRAVRKNHKVRTNS
jgi:hypothetical protein